MKKIVKILPLIIYLGVLVGLIILTAFFNVSEVWAIVWGFSPIALTIAFLVMASICMTLGDAFKDQQPSEETCLHKVVSDLDGKLCIGRELGCKSCEGCDYYERTIN